MAATSWVVEKEGGGGVGCDGGGVGEGGEGSGGSGLAKCWIQ